MMYNLAKRPEFLDLRDKGIVLRSSQNINFKEEKLNSEIYIRSPYVRGCKLWKQLSSNIQRCEPKFEFDRLLTEDLIQSLV